MVTYQEWADAVYGVQKRVREAIDAVNSLKALTPPTPYYPLYELDLILEELRRVETSLGRMTVPSR